MANVGGALKHFFHVHREAGVEGGRFGAGIECGRFGFRPRLGRRNIRRPTLTAASIFLACAEADIVRIRDRSVGRCVFGQPVEAIAEPGHEKFGIAHFIGERDPWAACPFFSSCNIATSVTANIA
jgi:hypothetical protein